MYMFTPQQAAGLTWHKAKASTHSGNCVEVANTPTGKAVRDSKNRGGPVLKFSTAEWAAFINGAREGEFD